MLRVSTVHENLLNPGLANYSLQAASSPLTHFNQPATTSRAGSANGPRMAFCIVYKYLVLNTLKIFSDEW